MEELSRHDRIIKQFVDTDEDHLWMHARFRKPPGKFTLRGLVEFLQYDDLDATRPTFVPDAWAVCFETNTVYMLEVVDCNKINPIKMQQIAELFWALDAVSFRLAMVVHDVTMGMTREVPFEQMSLWAVQGARGEPWNARAELQPA